MFNGILTMVIIGLISIIMLSSLAASIYILKTVRGIKRDLVEGEETGVFDTELMKKVDKRYRTAKENKIEEINTQAIIEKEFNKNYSGLNKAERFVKNAGSLMIIFGLLGTFTGLTVSVGKLLGNLNMADTGSVESMLEVLKGSMSGMAMAFTTSLAGIIGSIISTFVKVLMNPAQQREELMLTIEEYLDNVVAAEYVQVEPDDMDVIEERFEKLFDRLTEQVETGYRKVMEKSVGGLIEVAKLMEANGNNINLSVGKFDNAIDKFAADSREFSSFNLHLRDNISRMNVVLSDFSEKIESKEISK